MRGLDPASSDCCEVPARSDNRSLNWVSVHSRGVPTSPLPPGNNDPCRRVHRPRGQSPVGVSRRHKCARSTHAQPILPRWGQSRGVVSSGMGSVAVTNVHAQRMRGARPAPTRRVGSVPRWGQSPVGVSRRHKCARCEWACFCNGLRCPLDLAWGGTASATSTHLRRLRRSLHR